ncbi:MAG: hypothetical protein IKE20_00445, partial [Eggerthellaceae bacterium]|nr:hypothetical protein [Eggerthellaceae bacterium]
YSIIHMALCRHASLHHSVSVPPRMVLPVSVFGRAVHLAVSSAYALGANVVTTSIDNRMMERSVSTKRHVDD